ncbi:MAG: HlyD family efflux transporter periplasmic adaptor subunit [Planctomycetota bacterium]
MFHRWPNANALLMVIVSLSLVCGCQTAEEESFERRPRPVTVSTLSQGNAPQAALASGSVGSWKTEQIGFEVGGRVEFVAEPNTPAEGRVYDKNGNLIVDGTPIGRLENERYQLRVNQAKADVAQAEQSLVAAKVELNDTLPAQITAAVATRTLAKTEFDRSAKLLQQNAGSQGEVDRAKSEYENALAQIRQLDAAVKAKRAEVESLDNRVKQSQQSLRDAERDLEDCTLYASFRGQIADISVVPGSVVNAGQAVLTLQMMNPIKVELEVSAEQSRLLQRTRNLPVHFPMTNGKMARRDGYLYQIDPVADPETRTFTVTLLVLNEQMGLEDDGQTATTDDIWRLDLGFLPGSVGDELFVDEEALLEDDQGPYLWQITNASIGRNPPPDGQLQVRKLRVGLGPLKIPYLGSYVFQQVIVDDPEFIVGETLVAGKIKVESGEPKDWQGGTVRLVTQGQWMLRPGDLVQVDLSERNDDGFFVPMDAIVRKGDREFLFVIEGDETATAKAIPVALVDATDGPTSSLRRIESIDGSSLEGLTYVSKGAHYLIDGEPVLVVKEGGSGQ